MELVTEQPIVKRGPGRPRKVVISVKQDFAKINISKQGDYWDIREFPSTKNKYPCSLGRITISPTDNCQLFSYASFANLLTGIKIEEQLNVVKLASLKASKKLMLIDVKQVYVNKVEKLFTKDQIISKITYESTNNSNMNIFLIKVWNSFEYQIQTDNNNIQVK